MDRDAYPRALAEILDAHTAAVTTRLRRIAEVAAGPDGARVRGIVVDIFPDQDGEGTFDVWARFEGPDSFVLNRPIDDVRHLFGVVHTETGFEPAVPEPAPGATPDDVAEAIVVAVTAWLEGIWAGGVGSGVPFEVGHGGE